MLRYSRGWPMHCRNFLGALAEDIRYRDWRPDHADIDSVWIHAERLRRHYYATRMEGVLEGRYELLSMVLEELRRRGPMESKGIVAAIENALENEPLPHGMTASQLFETMLHRGIVQKVGEVDYSCPIPSLADHIAAMAARPSKVLHEAVLYARQESIDETFNRFQADVDRSVMLRATDMRGRTPLVLAVEHEKLPLVEKLMALELTLPESLRSTHLRDNQGRTAWDHANESDDKRIRALIEGF